MEAPRIIVLMGPAGAGKTTIGIALAKSLGWHFLDADDFHSPENVEKMRQAQALSEAERVPWLTAIRAPLVEAVGDGYPGGRAWPALKEKNWTRLCPQGPAK